MPWWYYAGWTEAFADWACLEVGCHFSRVQPQWAEMAEQLWAEKNGLVEPSK